MIMQLCNYLIYVYMNNKITTCTYKLYCTYKKKLPRKIGINFSGKELINRRIKCYVECNRAGATIFTAVTLFSRRDERGFAHLFPCLVYAIRADLKRDISPCILHTCGYMRAQVCRKRIVGNKSAVKSVL